MSERSNNGRSESEASSNGFVYKAQRSSGLETCVNGKCELSEVLRPMHGVVSQCEGERRLGAS